jgi:hypothetical protein
METRFSWKLLIVWLPLLPLLLRGVTKMLMYHFTLEVVSASELWFVLALICLLVSQDVKMRDVPLDNSDKKTERVNRANSFFVLFIIYVFCCPISEAIFISFSHNDSYIYSYVLLTAICYVATIFTIRFAFRTQAEFNLTAKFL